MKLEELIEHLENDDSSEAKAIGDFLRECDDLTLLQARGSLYLFIDHAQQALELLKDNVDKMGDACES